MKKKLITLILFAVMLAGCGSDEKTGIDGSGAETQSVQQSEVQTENNAQETFIVPETKMQETEETMEEPQFTLEDVQTLAAKKSALTLEDFAPYMNISGVNKPGGLSEILEFTYDGVDMCLRVTASSKSGIVVHYDGELDGAVLFRKDFLELDTQQKQYTYQGSCADIRAGELEHILNGTVAMEDYMTIILPEGLRQSIFKFWLGSRGGVTLLRAGEEEDEKTIYNTGIHGEERCAGGIEVWGSGELGQQLETVKELETYTIGDVELWRGIVQTEQGKTWYLAYTVKEGCSISYCFYLNGEEYTEEVFLAATETIEFQENSFY